MFDGEDLTIGNKEKVAGRLLRWLNERGCDYHIEVSEWRPPRPKHEDFHSHKITSIMMSMHDEDNQSKLHYDVLIYDDTTATLMSLFHEGFEEIISPEVLAAREAAAKAAEKEAARIAAIRDAEDEANARRVAKGLAPKPSSLDAALLEPELAPTLHPTDDASPPTRALLERIGKSLHAAIFGEGYTKTEAQRAREKR